MAEPWIRVHAALIDKPVVDRLSEALGVSEHEAIGLLVTFWGAVSQNVVGGHVGDQSDRQIEKWARWHGRRGRFANFIRNTHLDADGRVNEWDEYAGALEARREKERERLRNKRKPLRNTVSDVAQHRHETVKGVAPLLQPARAERNETIRDLSVSQSVSDAAEVESALAAELANDAERNALSAVIASANSPLACALSLRAMVAGDDTALPQPTAERFGQALVDFAANAERWNAAHFRGYVRRAKPAAEPEWIPPSQSANGSANGARAPSATSAATARRAAALGGARNDAAIDAWVRKHEPREPTEGPALPTRNTVEDSDNGE